MLRRHPVRVPSSHLSKPRPRHHSAILRRRRLAAEKLELRQLLAVTVLDHYEGLSFGDSGYAPPDTSGAIGVSSYIETVNQVIRITSTDGATISTRSLDDFFFSQGNLPRADARSFLSDPVVTFHEPTQRFIIGDQDVNFDTHVSNFDLAISKSSTPRTLTTADWYFLRLSTTEAGYDADYPGNFGWNRDALVFTLNMFGVTSSNSLYTQVNAVKISDLVNGTLTSYRTRLDDFSVRPAVMHGAATGDPMWLVSEGNDNQSLKLFKLSNVTTNFASYTTTTLRVNAYSTAKAPLQPSGQTVTTNIDSRLMNAAVRNGRLVTAHTVSTASNNDVARWYEISLTGSSPSLVQQGNVGGEANYYYTYPTIDLNEQNTMGLTFMKSGTAAGQFVSMYVTGRLSSDAVGTMQTPVLVRAGEKNQNFGRQGDLSGISVASDGTFWAANEYANSELWNWSTAIAHFRVGDSVTTPSNDAFSSSSTVIGKTVRATGSNVGASKEAGEPNHAGVSGGKSIWYRWTAPSSGFVSINTQGSSFDTLLGVYTGSAVNALNSIASNDNTGTGLTSSVSFNAVANTVYRIAVDGNLGATGSVNLNIDMTSSGPVNDAFTAASALAGYTVHATGSNMSATKELNEPNHAGQVGGRSVWWTWTAPAAGAVTLSTAGSSFNTLLAVYTGSTVGGLTAIAANNDFGAATTSQLTWNAIAGTTYRIAVDGLQGAAGNIALSLTLVASGPANDLFANAIPITGLTATVTGNSSGGSKEPGEPNHSGRSGGSSIWYNWVAPHTGRFVFDTNGSEFDTVIGIYTGDTVSNLTTIASDDDSGTNLRSRVMFRAISGANYRIAIDGFAGSSGAVTLHVNPLAPSNDLLANALLLGEADQAATLSVGTNVAASLETDEPLHAGVVGGHSVWWRWTATEALPVIVDTVGSSFDTLLAVYQGSSISDLQPIASDNDSGGNGISRLQFTPTTGVTYFFAVDGVAGATGDILMTLQPVAEGNDNFADAQVLTGSSAAAECNSLGATRETGEPNHAGAQGGKSVWYSWTAPFSGTVMMDTTGSNFDTLLAAYTGNSVDNLTVVAANDDANSRLTSNILFNAVEGVVYQIAVDGYRNAGGEVRFHLAFRQGPPPNDSFLAASTITGTSISITDSNINATRENREPLHANQFGGASVWYAWRAPESGRFSIDTQGSSFDTLLAVYTGSSLRSLRRVAANDDSGSSMTSRLTFNAKRGTTYWIAVDGYLGAQGIINLNLERALSAPHITPTKPFPGSMQFKFRSQQL